MFKKLEAALLGGLILAAALSPLSGFGAQCAAVRGDTLRLHIVAQSDSAGDQSAKLAVRDALLSAYGACFAQCDSRQEACALAQETLSEMRRLAIKTLRGRGKLEPVSAALTTMYFDTRDYGGGVVLPAGYYRAVRLTIGSGEGRNWWCVMYPPFCVGAAVGKTADRIESLTRQPEFELRFAAVELAEKLRGLWNPGA